MTLINKAEKDQAEVEFERAKIQPKIKETKGLRTKTAKARTKNNERTKRGQFRVLTKEEASKYTNLKVKGDKVIERVSLKQYDNKKGLRAVILLGNDRANIARPENKEHYNHLVNSVKLVKPLNNGDQVYWINASKYIRTLVSLGYRLNKDLVLKYHSDTVATKIRTQKVEPVVEPQTVKAPKVEPIVEPIVEEIQQEKPESVKHQTVTPAGFYRILEGNEAKRYGMIMVNNHRQKISTKKYVAVLITNEEFYAVNRPEDLIKIKFTPSIQSEGVYWIKKTDINGGADKMLTRLGFEANDTLNFNLKVRKSKGLRTKSGKNVTPAHIAQHNKTQEAVKEVSKTISSKDFMGLRHKNIVEENGMMHNYANPHPRLLQIPAIAKTFVEDVKHVVKAVTRRKGNKKVEDRMLLGGTVVSRPLGDKKTIISEIKKYSITNEELMKIRTLEGAEELEILAKELFKALRKANEIGVPRKTKSYRKGIATYKRMRLRYKALKAMLHDDRQKKYRLNYLIYHTIKESARLNSTLVGNTIIAHRDKLIKSVIINANVDNISIDINIKTPKRNKQFSMTNASQIGQIVKEKLKTANPGKLVTFNIKSETIKENVADIVNPVPAS